MSLAEIIIPGGHERVPSRGYLNHRGDLCSFFREKCFRMNSTNQKTDKTQRKLLIKEVKEESVILNHQDDHLEELF